MTSPVDRRSRRVRKSKPMTRRQLRGPITTPSALRSAIAKLSPAQPMTDQFSARWERPRGGEVWYKTQHEHWLGWLAEYSGRGGYGRQIRRRTAEYVYTHIQNPQMLVYLAEAAGLDHELVECAIEEALSQASMGSMSAAIRKTIPWRVIEDALTGPEARPSKTARKTR